MTLKNLFSTLLALISIFCCLLLMVYFFNACSCLPTISQVKESVDGLVSKRGKER